MCPVSIFVLLPATSGPDRVSSYSFGLWSFPLGEGTVYAPCSLGDAPYRVDSYDSSVILFASLSKHETRTKNMGLSGFRPCRLKETEKGTGERQPLSDTSGEKSPR